MDICIVLFIIFVLIGSQGINVYYITLHKKPSCKMAYYKDTDLKIDLSLNCTYTYNYEYIFVPWHINIKFIKLSKFNPSY